LVIDMQNGFCHSKGSFASMGADVSALTHAIDGCRRLIDAAHSSDVPVIFFKVQLRPDLRDVGVVFGEIMTAVPGNKALIAGSWDAEIVDELAPDPARDIVIEKNRFSGFFGTNLDGLLRSLGIDTLVVTGVGTDVCVDSTVRDAAQLNYRCIIPREAVGTTDPDINESILRVMQHAFARVVDVDDVVGAWKGETLIGDWQL
jgi:ureidoacrylate peracid hydrolase